MEQAIKKAIEGGWVTRYPSLPWKSHPDGIQFLAHEGIIVVEIYAIVCDPLFWQALGKAKGWHIHQDKSPHWFYDTGYSEKCMRCVYHKFYEINITNGLDKAIEYLNELIT